MPRLFTALWLPQPIVAELDAALSGAGRWPPEGWRAIPPRRWHVTLCFHGQADPGVLVRRLDSATTGLTAPWLRLAGAVSLGAVIAAVVHPGTPGDRAALAELVAAAGADQETHRPHVSVARTSRRSDSPPPGGPLEGFVGSWWRPSEVCLVRSETSSGSPRYIVEHRVELHADPGRGAPQEGDPRGSMRTRCQH